MNAFLDVAQQATVAGSLASMIKQREERLATEQRLKETIDLIRRNEEAEDEDEAPNGFRRLIGRAVRKLVVKGAKFLLRKILRPVFSFVIRVGMNLARMATQMLLRFIIVPVIEGIVAFVLANPLTLAIGAAVLAVGGGGYWIWNKFFKDLPPPKDVSGPQLELVKAPNVLATSYVSQPQQLVAQAPQPSFFETPVEYAKSQYQKLTGFKGFGQDIDAYIKEASARFAIPEDILRGFIRMEAGWTGKMSPTGAIGAGQFVQDTWDRMAASAEGAALGMTKIGSRFRQPDDPRRDQHLNILATSLLARNNAAILQKNGLPLTGENLYMMHNIGPGIIPVMLGLPASDATIKAMKQNGMLKDQSASEFLQYQKAKFNKFYAEANQQSNVIPEGVVIADSVTQNKSQKTLSSQSKQATPLMTSKSKGDKEIIKGPGSTLIGISNG